MYLQLTTVCNMKCAHCCFAATTKGHMMSGYVYIAALELAANFGEHITLGGGEPTVHPDFFKFLDKAIALYRRGSLETPPHLVTNGKLVTKARKLLDYIEQGQPVQVELSRDEWHEPIRPEIARAFEALQRHSDARRKDYSQRMPETEGGAGIRTVRSIVPVGRAAALVQSDTSISSSKCACETMCVDPHGNVFSCGCKTHLLGNVFEPTSTFNGYDQELAHEGAGLPAREFARLGQPLAMAA